MIVYHPAYDINHCAFRFISLLSDVENYEMNWDSLKILDFYYVFPHLLEQVRLPKNLIANKNTLSRIPLSYETLPNPQRLMFGLSALHNEAARALIARRLIDKDLFLKNIVKLDIYHLPASLAEVIISSQQRKTVWYSLLVNVLAQYPTEGNNGLKSRTNLMEYRYD